MQIDKKQNTSSVNLTSNEETKGVKTLLGDPKKAILTLSFPMIIALLVQTSYNLVDTIWVSGLGADALAAVGFVFPFIFMAIALGTGIGIGGGAAISRKIGSQDKEGADTVAVHTLVIMTISAFFFTIPFYVFAPAILTAIGAGQTTDMATTYAQIMALGTIITFFTFVAAAILRAEGDAKRAMIAIVFGSVLNVILDPIFIYVLDLGVAGAAWASLLSMALCSCLLIYWLFVKKDTYVTLSRRGLKYDKVVMYDILRVGIPASIMQLSMAIMTLIINIIIIAVNGTDGVAVFQTGWRIATIATMPLLGIATAVISVAGAAYGAQDYGKLQTAFLYSLRIGIIIEVIVATATFIFAPAITTVFTFAEGSARLADGITEFLQIIIFFYPASAFGILSSAVFQGVGKGLYSLIVTIIRTIVFTAPLAYILAVVFTFGITGVWWGIVASNITAAIIGFIWIQSHIMKLKKKAQPMIQ